MEIQGVHLTHRIQLYFSTLMNVDDNEDDKLCTQDTDI